MKMSNERYQKYKQINVNGFRVNMAALLYPVSHGDEYPKLERLIYSKDNTHLITRISFMRRYDKSVKYMTEVIEFKEDGGLFLVSDSQEQFHKVLYSEEMASGRFSQKKLEAMAKRVNQKVINDVIAEFTIKNKIA